MGDPELEAIRAKRLAELQGSRGGGGGGAGGQNVEEEKKKIEDMKNVILSQALSQAARARLNTLMVAKPDKAAVVENIILQMAQRGQLGGKMGEDELIGLLEKVNQQIQTKKTTVKFDRRRAGLGDSDDDLDDL